MKTKGNIGLIIRRIRFDHKISQRQMADELGVSAISIHSYEHNKRKPSLSVYKALIEFSPDDEKEILDTVDIPVGSFDKKPSESNIIESLKITIELQKEIILLLRDKIKGMN